MRGTPDRVSRENSKPLDHFQVSEKHKDTLGTVCVMNIQIYFQSPSNEHYNYWNQKLQEIEEKNDIKIFRNTQPVISEVYLEFKNELIEIKDKKYHKVKQAL